MNWPVKSEEEPTSSIQVSMHHISNSAVSLIFRLIGGFVLVEIGYALLLAPALTPSLSQYRQLAIGLIWALFVVKFLAESAFFVLLVANWAGTNYYISNGHLVRYQGIRRRDEHVYDLSILKSVELHQGWWGRMFGYGDLKLVFSSSGYLETVLLQTIYNPKKYERVLKSRLNVIETSKANEPWAEGRISV